MQEQIAEACANNQDQFIRAYLRSYGQNQTMCQHSGLDSSQCGNDKRIFRAYRKNYAKGRLDSTSCAWDGRYPARRPGSPRSCCEPHRHPGH